MTVDATIPLFPLHTVLFPGGPLNLRIFEPRYLDMVSERLRAGEPFGVVLIKDGQETGAADFWPQGTAARIVDFDQLDDGLLGLTCRGEARFMVIRHHSRDDGLVLGEVQWLAPEPSVPVPAQYTALLKLLRDILNRAELSGYRRILCEDWDDVAWVSHRLSELLPIPTAARQALLEMRSGEQRMAVIGALLQARAEGQLEDSDDDDTADDVDDMEDDES